MKQESSGGQVLEALKASQEAAALRDSFLQPLDSFRLWGGLWDVHRRGLVGIPGRRSPHLRTDFSLSAGGLPAGDPREGERGRDLFLRLMC